MVSPEKVAPPPIINVVVVVAPVASVIAESDKIVQAGAFPFAVPKVSVHDVTTPPPTVIFPLVSVAPADSDGLVPHEDNTGTG